MKERFVGVAILCAIVAGMVGGYAAHTVEQQAPSTITVSTTDFTTITLEDSSLSGEMSSLNAVASQQASTIQSQRSTISSLSSQASIQQTEISSVDSIAVYQLLHNSITGSSVIVGCATPPITNFVMQRSGEDISSSATALVTAALPTASFNLTGTAIVDPNVFRANATVVVTVQVPHIITVPVQESIGITALVDLAMQTVDDLTCVDVGTPTIG